MEDEDFDLEADFAAMAAVGPRDGGAAASSAVEAFSGGECRWEGCSGPEYPNVDALVDHVNANHMEGDWACMWQDCSRLGVPQSSRTTLAAHVRSHTGERPFYCVVPECLKSFSRSDAVLKHIKTLHGMDAGSVPEALEEIAETQRRQMENFMAMNGDGVNGASAALDGAVVAANFTSELESEQWQRYNVVIDAYYQLKALGVKQDIINAKVDYVHHIGGMRLSPAGAKAVLKSTKQALETHAEAISTLESARGPTSVANLDIGALSREELESAITSMEEYETKLGQLGSVLDQRLLSDTKKARLAWCRKELVVQAIQASSSSLANRTTSMGV